jgi:hypothetical protein
MAEQTNARLQALTSQSNLQPPAPARPQHTHDFDHWASRVARGCLAALWLGSFHGLPDACCWWQRPDSSCSQRLLSALLLSHKFSHLSGDVEA